MKKKSSTLKTDRQAGAVRSLSTAVQSGTHEEEWSSTALWPFSPRNWNKVSENGN